MGFRTGREETRPLNGKNAPHLSLRPSRFSSRSGDCGEIFFSSCRLFYDFTNWLPVTSSGTFHSNPLSSFSMETVEEAKRRIEKLRAEIAEHDRRYYLEADPTISDERYDQLYRELRDLEEAFPEFVTPESPTQRVSGAPLESFRQMTHRTPMLSLDNTYSEGEVADFFRRLERLLPGETIDAVIEPKVDGVAISLLYRRGILEYAATRGNGIVGDEGTADMRTVRAVPLRLHGSVPEGVQY